MEQVLQGGLKVFEFFFNMAKWATLKVLWTIVTTVGYILRTGFVGLHLGAVLGAAEGGTGVNIVYDKVVQIFHAVIQSITHAIGVIPETLKPLVQVSLFALTQFALEQLHAAVPVFFTRLLNDDAGLKSMRDIVEGVFGRAFEDDGGSKGGIQPTPSDVAHAAKNIKANLAMADVVTSVVLRKRLDRWNRNAKAHSPSMKELTRLCMTTKGQHASNCSGKGITKKVLYAQMKPYLHLLKTM